MKTIDLFSGAGGLSLGLERAGANIVACVEINRDAIDTYTSCINAGTYFNEDVREINFLVNDHLPVAIFH